MDSAAGSLTPAESLRTIYALFIRNRFGGEGTVRTDSVIFGVLLLVTALIVSGLSFFPVLTLGPILENLAGIKR